MRYADTTRIYDAWSDEGWVNEGAAVRVSLVALECNEAHGEGVPAITPICPQLRGRPSPMTTHRSTQSRNSFLGIKKAGV